MPGYRNEELLSDLPNLPACKSNADYGNASQELTSTAYLLWRSNEARNTLDSCYSRCGTPCETWTYQLQQKVIANPEGVNVIVRNYTDQLLNNFEYSTWVLINTLKSEIKVYEEQLAFGWNQLVGEIGGTWGLYLGLSFGSIFYFFDRVITNYILLTHY
jgi:hypothetical protein